MLSLFWFHVRKSPGSLLGGPNQVYDEIDNLRAYKKVLETWSKWVHIHIDPAKTKMFFMGLTATHSRYLITKPFCFSFMVIFSFEVLQISLEFVGLKTGEARSTEAVIMKQSL